ncbi:MAG: UDP-2,3-diacylglucosamine diphosphatase LpxI [Rhodospirillaceae bacterium]|jgi:UDP-2,3-diacylglucosamine hydrolase|nr:UDP-2,3-diacylglucosamine diphosphatase LpxI [Rhodospirillaceae bacterium]MBT5658960.1 UDP-2,3-diacylglucosamine diphosphatase LpxI [Rhodospirillaceae bacterium]MBT5752940.1 UDP-2,3-diacylglucosamine diphosphatase LpxI [Rhodospirillaceae bacterium]
MPPDTGSGRKIEKLGIFAGGGELPKYILAACRAAERDVFVLAFEGQTDPETVKDVPHLWTRFGNIGGALETLKGEGVGEIVLAGAIARPSLLSLKPDAATAKLAARLLKSAFGDDKLLGAVIAELEKMGFKVIGADELLEHLVAIEGPYGVHRPDAQARSDIARGVEVARALGSADVGQSVVVQQGIVLGVEAVEGTDALIARAKNLSREGPGGVLVKLMKPGQDRRADLPSIGPATVAAAGKAGLSGIAVEMGRALVLDGDEIARRADAAGIFVTGIKAQA